MFIKNASRLLLSNLKTCFKTTLCRLICTIVYFWTVWLIVNVGFEKIFSSDEFALLLENIKGLWLNFSKMDFEATVNLKASAQGVLEVIKENMLQSSIVAVMLFIVTYIFFVFSGLCSYVSSVMLHKHMSALQKTKFLAIFLDNFKRAIAFETFFAIIKICAYLLIIAILYLFVVLTGNYIGLMSAFIGLWLAIALIALFFALTTKLRAGMVLGMSFKEVLKQKCLSKEMLLDAFGTYFFSIIIAIYFNVTMFFATLGAGILVSIPMSYLYFVILQLVIMYTAKRKRYFIDYERIITPIEMRSSEEKLLNEVDL